MGGNPGNVPFFFLFSLGEAFRLRVSSVTSLNFIVKTAREARRKAGDWGWQKRKILLFKLFLGN